MRSLKFRVWDIERECYLDETELAGITPDGKYIFYIEEEEISRLEVGENYIVEQYTGLKDKNGKEVYEGDVVRDGKGEKCRVEWNESEAHFGLYAGEQMELTDFIWMRGEDLEVIGNVHENSELLKGK